MHVEGAGFEPGSRALPSQAAARAEMMRPRAISVKSTAGVGAIWMPSWELMAARRMRRKKTPKARVARVKRMMNSPWRRVVIGHSKARGNKG